MAKNKNIDNAKEEDTKTGAYNVSKDETSGGSGSSNPEDKLPWWMRVLNKIYW